MTRLALLIVLLLVGCTSAANGPSPLARRTVSTVGVPTSCRYTPAGGPDAVCTPGAIDARVTQATVATTVCVPGYTATVRPPVSYTGPLKVRLMWAYGDLDTPSAFELDHEIPLELGGAPRDPANLWPEPIADARVKDGRENALHRAICNGTTTLAAAQAEMRGWHR